MAGLLEGLQERIGLAGQGLGDAARGGGRILGEVFTPIAQKGPEDLSDIAPAKRVVLGLLDAVAKAGGQSGMLEQLMAKRQQQAAQKKKALLDNLAVLDKMRGFLDTVPLEQRAERAGKLKERFKTDFGGPGSDELFDSVLGDLESAPGVIGQAAEDPEVSAYLQRADANMEGVKAILDSEGYRARSADTQDLKLLPGIEKKVSGLLSAQSPTLRAAVQAALKDGQLTIEEIRAVNDAGGDGPEGTRLTPAELATLGRRQDDLAARIPGFKASDQFAADRKRAQDLEDFRAKERIKAQEQVQKAGSQLNREEYEARRQIDAKYRSPRQTEPRQHQWAAAGYGRRVEQALGEMEAIDYDRTALVGGGAQSLLPNALRSSGRQQQDQAERNFVNAVLRKESGAVISENEFKNAEKQYFPRAGDSPQVIEQKSRNRLQALQNLQAEAGAAWEQVRGIGAAGAASEPPAAAGEGSGPSEVRRKTKDGRTAIFDATTKQFLRYE